MRRTVGKYAPYFQGNKTLPIPEFFCRSRAKDSVFYHYLFKDQEISRSLKGDVRGTLEIRRHPMLTSEELAVKLAGSNVSTKHFWLQPEYRSKRQIQVTVCNVPIRLNEDAEEVTQIRSAGGMAHGDYVLNVCVDRKGFQAIPHILTYKDQQIMVVVEGRRLLC